MAVLHSSNSGVCVPDLGRSTAYYRDALGFRQHHNLHFEGEPLPTLLEIKDVALDVVYLEPDGTVTDLLYFPEQVATRDAVPRETQVGKHSGESCVIVATDPDGCLLELVQSPADPTRLPLQPDDLERRRRFHIR